MAGKPLTVYTTDKNGNTSSTIRWGCPRAHAFPPPCIGCSADVNECEASELFAGIPKPAGYGKEK
jgi:hypothetical protein